MFITFKLTLKKLFVITAAVILAVLGVDVAKGVLMPQSQRYVTHTDRAAYLKTQGLEIETEPIYSKETVVDETGGSGWAEYAQRLKNEGFDITGCYGKKVNVVCYPLKTDSHKAVRMLLCDNRVAAYEVIDGF